MKYNTRQIAENHAKTLDYNGVVHDVVRNAGTRNGYDYFVITSTALLGRKTGLPYVAKISTATGNVATVDRLDEKMRAIAKSNEQ